MCVCISLWSHEHDEHDERYAGVTKRVRVCVCVCSSNSMVVSAIENFCNFNEIGDHETEMITKLSKDEQYQNAVYVMHTYIHTHTHTHTCLNMNTFSDQHMVFIVFSAFMLYPILYTHTHTYTHTNMHMSSHEHIREHTQTCTYTSYYYYL